MTCDNSEVCETKSYKRRSSSSSSDSRMQQDEKRARIEVTLATSESHQLSQIESEFQILKSLIPNIADRKQINEVNEIEKPYNCTI